MSKKFVLFFTLLLFSIALIAQQNIIYDIQVKGIKKVKTSFIKKILVTKVNSVLDSTDLEMDMTRLKRLPAVSHAYYKVFLSHENYYNVFVHLDENFTIIPNTNFYTTNNDEFAYRVGVNEFNLFGHGIGIGGFFQRDIYNSYVVNFRAPFLFNRKLGIAFNYQNLTTLEPLFFDNSSANYKYNNKSYELLGLYQLNFKNRIEIGVNLFTEDYEYVFGATYPNVSQSLIIDKTLFKFIYDYNAIDYFYETVNGFRSLLNAQYVYAREDNAMLPDFIIFWNDFLYYKRVGEKGNWANRMRVGFATNDDTPFAPFSVDNNVNIRGVGNVIDRGTGVVVINTEYRYRLYKKKDFLVQGNAFIDAGTWRNPGGTFDDLVDRSNIRVYLGLGLRFIHRKFYNAIFRIDYGYGITKNAAQGFVIGIGQYF